VKLASGEMAVSGDQWPMLVYANQEYDPNDPWSKLFRSQLLIYVSVIHINVDLHRYLAPKAFKYIFTSPSSVEKEVKAMWLGNARIHGMTTVTTASIAHTTTQVYP
jgi:hypothetical protein